VSGIILTAKFFPLASHYWSFSATFTSAHNVLSIQISNLSGNSWPRNKPRNTTAIVSLR